MYVIRMLYVCNNFELKNMVKNKFLRYLIIWSCICIVNLVLKPQLNIFSYHATLI